MRLENYFKDGFNPNHELNRDTFWPGYHGYSPERLTGKVGIGFLFSYHEIRKKIELRQD